MSYSLLEAWKELNESSTYNTKYNTDKRNDIAYHATIDVNTLIDIFNQRVIKRKYVSSTSNSKAFAIYFGDAYDDKDIPLHLKKNESRYTCAINFNSKFKDKWLTEYDSDFLRAIEGDNSFNAAKLRVDWIEKVGNECYMQMSNFFPGQESIKIPENTYNLIKSGMEQAAQDFPELQSCIVKKGNRINFFNKNCQYSKPLLTTDISKRDSKRKPENGIYIIIPVKDAIEISEEDEVKENEYLIKKDNINLDKEKNVRFQYDEIAYLTLPQTINLMDRDKNLHSYNLKNMLEEYEKLDGKEKLIVKRYGNIEDVHNTGKVINFCIQGIDYVYPGRKNLENAGFNYNLSSWLVKNENNETIRLSVQELKKLYLFFKNIIDNKILIKWL